MKSLNLFRFFLIASLVIAASVKTSALPYTPGDVFISYGPNLYTREFIREYSPTGAVVQTLDTGPLQGEGTLLTVGYLGGSALIPQGTSM